MKRGITIAGGSIVVLLILVAAYAFGLATPRDLAQFPECLNCGMSRKDCTHTRMTVEYADGTKGAECSLHCLLATIIEQPGRQVTKIFAADYGDKKLAEAERCWWVRYDNAVPCRGSRVMLAFRSEEGADRFVASYGGEKMTFYDALSSTYCEIEGAGSSCNGS